MLRLLTMVPSMRRVVGALMGAIPGLVSIGLVLLIIYYRAFFVPFILVATFTMLNLFIAIIVNAMQSYTEDGQRETVAAVEQAREHIEADLHAEVRAMRAEIRELKTLLLQGQLAKDMALPPENPTQG